MSIARAPQPEPETQESLSALRSRVAELEAALEALAERDTSEGRPVSPNGARKPKGGPIGDAMRRDLVLKRERLELARLAEQAAWEDVKSSVCDAAEAGVSYREIGDAIGVTRARVYQIVSGKR